MSDGRRHLAIYGGLDEGARPVVREQIAEALTAGADPAAVIDVVGRGVDAQWLALEEIGFPGEAPPACRPGCSWCCAQRVELTTWEVVRLALALRTHPEKARIEARVRAVAEATQSFDEATWRSTPTPCALLDETGRCSVYEERPLACRRAHSTDASACEAAQRSPASAAPIPQNKTLAWNLASLVIGALEGYAHAGHPPHHHELHAALGLALDDAGFEARLRAGEDLFASARSTDAASLPSLLGDASPPVDEPT
jgi:Fe-S-cluster containining protein